MFHMPDVPVEIFAVRIDHGGVHWFPAELVRVTQRNVMVRYGCDSARLDRERLWRAWAFWRGVMFVSSRSGPFQSNHWMMCLTTMGSPFGSPAIAIAGRP
jgi:hypothetical protein